MVLIAGIRRSGGTHGMRKASELDISWSIRWSRAHESVILIHL